MASSAQAGRAIPARTVARRRSMHELPTRDVRRAAPLLIAHVLSLPRPVLAPAMMSASLAHRGMLESHVTFLTMLRSIAWLQSLSRSARRWVPDQVFIDRP